MAAGAVEGEHELLVEPLAQRHPLDQLRELADRVAVAAQPELQVDAAFRRHPAQLLQPGDLATGELHAGDVLERIAAPHAQGTLDVLQRLAQLRLGPQRVQRRERPCRHLEPMGVDLLRLHQEGVAAGPGLQYRRPVRLGGTEGLAQIRHLDLQGVGRIARQLVAPQQIDQEVRRHRMTAAQHQGDEDRPRQAASDRHHAGGTSNLQRPEDAELH